MLSLYLLSIGVETGLEPRFSISFNKSSVYFHWEINRPLGE
jgi:hypothetical protein